ncbi:SDR family oxidoreductase [Amycolatopsis acidicola]|uniref:SDR family oxidoreductase n=1 Tax=Amycolatopsis acidicola TaxID=2596893 RepID=A0A5N0V0V7_9PSEU|nr:SDR family oxidoreductase [Amycolatopsis acidicola]KAA9157774.1 SDR family oxidoreductase [Amycolatopsis acidicola]
MTELSGKIALVTGGGGGFGRAISARLAGLGAHVAVLDRDPVSGKATVAGIVSAGGQATFHEVDLTDAEAVDAVVAGIVREHGALDIAVNNAGIGGAMAPMADYPLEDWHRVVDVNLNSVFYCLRAQLRVMGSGGSIVNVASIMSTVAMPTISAYVATKHAVLGLTRSAALEYGPQGIRVNAVGPSFSRVGFTADSLADDAHWDSLREQHPLGRTANPEDIAGAVVQLCSGDSSFVTGQLLLVDGGFTLR